jgi:hypothetical protein
MRGEDHDPERTKNPARRILSMAERAAGLSERDGGGGRASRDAVRSALADDDRPRRKKLFTRSIPEANDAIPEESEVRHG